MSCFQGPPPHNPWFARPRRQTVDVQDPRSGRLPPSQQLRQARTTKIQTRRRLDPLRRPRRVSFSPLLQRPRQGHSFDAKAVTSAMQQLGVPAALATVLCAQWTNQKRLLQWRQSTGPTVLCTDMAVPQGDAMSPLALNVCMYAGARFVEQQVPAEPN